ncbi:MAG: pyridoxal-phosphate dependent enzyme [Candidatus Peribacteraceae bacterium]|nr:pyridoxal-phosphate dependent enzyme [Candidatus Peribacteraceae bacterium]
MKTPLSAFANRLNKRTGYLAEQFPPADTLEPERRQRLDEEISRIVGHTRLQFIPVGKGGIFLKLETDNPSETHYDRVYPYLIRSLERRGIIVPGVTEELYDSSSGSAGPSMNCFAKTYGYRPFNVLPQGLPPARINAHEETASGIIVSRYQNYLEGMIQTVRELLEDVTMQEKLRSKKAVFLNHSRRKETPEAFRAIGKEVIDQLPNGVELDTWICAMGNGTHIRGISEESLLRSKNEHEMTEFVHPG